MSFKNNEYSTDMSTIIQLWHGCFYNINLYSEQISKEKSLTIIQTHLAYIANAKELCYMKQQSQF